MGRVNIVYFADSHTDGIYSHIHLDNVKRTVEFANNAPIEYDAVINAGDMITPFGKTPKEKAYKMADTAFNFDDKCEKDWGIIITLHQYPKELKYHENAADVLLDLCVALNEQGTYSHKYQHKENSFFDMDVNADFTRYANEEGKPHMICWLLGHIHERKNEVRKGINMRYLYPEFL